MERPDRGPAAQLPGARGLPESSALLQRPGQVPHYAALPNGPVSVPSLRNASSSATLSASNSTTSSQVIALAREVMRNALESETNQAAEAGAVGPRLRSGVTIDLSRKNIQQLPEEVVDIVKNELERLALSHNQLSSLPARFSECTSLRYLNIRGNQIKEFPIPLCELKSLEILDLGRNQLRELPNEISRLSSLKVLSVPKNQIRELPLCLADMVSLQVLKFEGNPISFPPKDAIRPQTWSPYHEGVTRDIEVTEVAVTAHIKKYLRQHAINGRMESEATGDESIEADTLRFQIKRATSGRFPIKVNCADVPDLRSPINGPRPPPIPSRSHYRGLSQQNTAIRRPGVMPLTIGNVNERLRSNSETLLRSDRPDVRNRRMGIVSRKTSELGTLDEMHANVRFSNHFRGLSHGSAAMQGTLPRAKSPATPTESYLQRPIYVRRLSILPERRRTSAIFDPIMEAAKGILYSVFQIHPMIQMLMTLTNDGSAKRSSLEIVFYNTNSHVEELEQEIQKHDTEVAEGDEHSPHENENVHRACQTLVSAYGHVCTLLADNIDTFVDNGDARYIRTLLMLLYNSIMELRVTLSSISTEHAKSRPSNQDMQSTNDTIRPYHREPSATSAAEQPVVSRNRHRTVAHGPTNLRVTTDVAAPYLNANGRSISAVSATPRSGDSFSSSHSEELGSDFPEDEDAQFDRIFLSLQKSADVVLRTLPHFQAQLKNGRRNAVQQRAPMTMVQDWESLITMCSSTILQTENLRNRLSHIKLKEPGIRTQPSFWNQCNSFVTSWTTMAGKIKKAINTIPLPPDIRIRLRPIQQSMKRTSKTIVQSPWHHLFRPPGAPGGMTTGPFASQITSPAQVQVPMTPQNAALGPAMPAAVSATPHSASFAAAFQGNVFDRADALIANPGISMSRGARGHSGFNSLPSISSLSSDGNTPSSSSAPNPNSGLGLVPPRVSGGRVAI